MQLLIKRFWVQSGKHGKEDTVFATHFFSVQHPQASWHKRAYAISLQAMLVWNSVNDYANKEGTPCGISAMRREHQSMRRQFPTRSTMQVTKVFRMWDLALHLSLYLHIGCAKTLKLMVLGNQGTLSLWISASPRKCCFRIRVQDAEQTLSCLIVLGFKSAYNTISFQNLQYINSHHLLFIVYETCIFHNFLFNYCSTF